MGFALLCALVCALYCLSGATGAVVIKINDQVTVPGGSRVFIQPDQTLEISCSIAGASLRMDLSDGVNTSRIITSEPGMFVMRVAGEDGSFRLMKRPGTDCTDSSVRSTYSVFVYQATMTPDLNITLSTKEARTVATDMVKCSIETQEENPAELENFLFNIILQNGNRTLGTSNKTKGRGTVEFSPDFRHELGGQYSCSIQSIEDSTFRILLSQTINTTPLVYQTFEPVQSQYITGDSLDVYCEVFGYPAPVPTLTFSEEDSTIETIKALTVDENNPNKYGRLISKLQHDEDRGTWTCTAYNGNGRVSKGQLLRVRDNLAPLWPFIGILIQVVITAIIIVVSERLKKQRKAKKAAQADS